MFGILHFLRFVNMENNNSNAAIKIIGGVLILVAIAFAVVQLRGKDDGLVTNTTSPTRIPAPPVVVLPACTESLVVPNTDVIYYVATNEPGADNQRCDGLSPTNEGNNRCPFKDFTSPSVREKLFLTPDGNFGTKSVTVKVRKGTYFIHPLRLFPKEPLQPLMINANGQSDRESVILMNYNGEKAVLDGSCPTSFSTCNYPDAPGKIWTLLEIYGSNVIVQGLTFDNAYGRNIQIGSANTHIRCNKLIGSYSSDSDSKKSCQR